MKRVSFTLVELMVAIVIIAILGTIVAAGSGYVTDKVKESKTKSQIQKLELALEKYKSEYDFYYVPCEVSSGGSITYFNEAREFNPNPKPESITLGSKTIRERDAGMVKFCSRIENGKSLEDKSYIPKTFLGKDYVYADEATQDGEEFRNSGLRDGWGNFLMYRCPGRYNKTKYDIWSRGADGDGLKYNDEGQDDEDDITNWKLQD